MSSHWQLPPPDYHEECGKTNISIWLHVLQSGILNLASLQYHAPKLSYSLRQLSTNTLFFDGTLSSHFLVHCISTSLPSMKVSPLFTASMLALAGFTQASNGMDLATEPEAAYCTWEFMDLGAYWLIRAKGAENIGTICHHFWNGLKQFGAACSKKLPETIFFSYTILRGETPAILVACVNACHKALYQAATSRRRALSCEIRQ